MLFFIGLCLRSGLLAGTDAEVQLIDLDRAPLGVGRLGVDDLREAALRQTRENPVGIPHRHAKALGKFLGCDFVCAVHLHVRHDLLDGHGGELAPPGYLADVAVGLRLNEHPPVGTERSDQTAVLVLEEAVTGKNRLPQGGMGVVQRLVDVATDAVANSNLKVQLLPEIARKSTNCGILREVADSLDRGDGAEAVDAPV